MKESSNKIIDESVYEGVTTIDTVTVTVSYRSSLVFRQKYGTINSKKVV